MLLTVRCSDNIFNTILHTSVKQYYYYGNIKTVLLQKGFILEYQCYAVGQENFEEKSSWFLVTVEEIKNHPNNITQFSLW